MKRAFICTVTVILFMVFAKSVNVFSFFIANSLYPLFEAFDPDQAFIILTVHHICYAVIVFSLIFALSKVLNIPLFGFGFNLNGFRYSLKAVLIFAGIWALIQAGAGVLIITVFKTSSAFGFPLSVKNFTGYFLFEILLSGTCEELMFRALVITLLLHFWKSLFKNDSRLAISVIASATLIFMFDHINFTVFPFNITHFDILQQLTVMIFGIFYGYLFVKTRSVAGPILAHNLLNGIIVVTGLALFLTFG